MNLINGGRIIEDALIVVSSVELVRDWEVLGASLVYTVLMSCIPRTVGGHTQANWYTM